MTCSLAAAAGAVVAGVVPQPLIIPAVVLILVTLDWLRFPER